MQKSATYRMVLAGFLVGLGLLLPFVTAHAFGMPGTVFLPMHIPVFLMGLLCGPLYGATGGILIPVLSCLFTGMPPLFPMLPIMSGELFTYGLTSGLLYRKAKLSIYVSLPIAMVSGRLVYGLIFQGLLLANHGSLKALSVTGALVAGIPGIVIQLILLPAIVYAVNRYLRGEFRTEPAAFAAEKATRLVETGKRSCAVIKNGKIISTAKGQGIAPLLTFYENEPEILKGAFVIDKVIGKAAAMILILGGTQQVYGALMSSAALEYLTEHGCKADFGKKIDVVANRSGDGICPLESSVMDIEDPQIGYHRLKETISQLKNAV